MIGQLRQNLLLWWSQRPAREQKIMAVAGVLIVVAFFYNYVYHPLAAGHAVALAGFQKATSDYRWIKDRMQEVDDMGIGGVPPQETLEQMQSSVEKHLAAQNIQTVVNRVEQRGQYYFEVPLNNVNGSHVMRWIEILMNRGYQISNFRLENTQGKVSGRVVIRVVK